MVGLVSFVIEVCGDICRSRVCDIKDGMGCCWPPADTKFESDLCTFSSNCIELVLDFCCTKLATDVFEALFDPWVRFEPDLVGLINSPGVHDSGTFDTELSKDALAINFDWDASVKVLVLSNSVGVCLDCNAGFVPKRDMVAFPINCVGVVSIGDTVRVFNNCDGWFCCQSVWNGFSCAFDLAREDSWTC